jgi:LEA14-like dessication related protein
VFRVALLALSALLLAACSSGPVKRVFPPEARVQEIRLQGDRANVLLRVQSFSTVPSEVEAYALTLEFAGTTAARLEGETATTVLPQAAETLAIETTLDAASLERAKAALANGTALRYRLHGTITVEPNGRAYPIDYSSALSRAPGLDGVLR